MSGDYVCSLSEKSIKKAQKELNEEPKERSGAVQALREWIEREPWITSPTDTLFLLAFLRVSKFSQLKTRERLGNFLSHLNKVKFTVGHDPGDPKSLEIIREWLHPQPSESVETVHEQCTQGGLSQRFCGIYAILPGTDKDGRRVVLCKTSAIDTSGRYSYDDFLVAVVPLFHGLMFFDEEEQVNGITFLFDYGGVHMSIMTWMGLDNLRNLADFMNKAYPARIQGLNYYNTGAVFEAAMEISKPLLSKKLRERIHVHHTMVSVYEQVGMSILPIEYLPDDYTGPSAGKVQDIIEDNIKEFILDPVKRDWMKHLYSGDYSADLSKKPTEMDATASFRKLNVS